MIAVDWSLAFLVRFAAPIAWRDEAHIAARLEGFAATEAGSALDMLKAAELAEDPLHRRLFFRHALDEARHATMFREAARRIHPDPRHVASEHTLIHATRQNLYAELGPVRFLAFVHLAEARARAQFGALERHFADRPELSGLFATIGKDERFHVAYSKWLLGRLRKEGRGREVSVALARVRLERAWQAWRRMGRRMGDVVTRLLLLFLYFVVVAPFALLERRLGKSSSGWQSAEPNAPASAESRLASARRQH